MVIGVAGVRQKVLVVCLPCPNIPNFTDMACFLDEFVVGNNLVSALLSKQIYFFELGLQHSSFLFSSCHLGVLWKNIHLIDHCAYLSLAYFFAFFSHLSYKGK